MLISNILSSLQEAFFPRSSPCWLIGSDTVFMFLRTWVLSQACGHFVFFHCYIIVSLCLPLKVQLGVAHLRGDGRTSLASVA